MIAPMSKATKEAESDVAVSEVAASCGQLPDIDYHRLLTKYFSEKDPKMPLKSIPELLEKYKGKEAKLMLMLAKKYDSSNPLNRVFVDNLTPEHYDDYPSLTQLYLSIFYPQDIEQAESLSKVYAGKEDELFKKLSANFHSINPLKMKKKIVERPDERIHYKDVLTTFYREHDADKVADVDDVLSKCRGKESILFSVLAKIYKTSNVLNIVFEERLKGVDCTDHVTLLRLYLSVFHPSRSSDAKGMISKWRGNEDEMFSELALKFKACNPLDLARQHGKCILDSITEEGTKPTVIHEDGCVSPNKVRSVRVPQSPAITP